MAQVTDQNHDKAIATTVLTYIGLGFIIGAIVGLAIGSVAWGVMVGSVGGAVTAIIALFTKE